MEGTVVVSVVSEVFIRIFGVAHINDVQVMQSL